MAASKTLSILIAAKDEASKTFDRLSGNLRGPVIAAAAAATAAIGALAAEIAFATRAAAQAERDHILLAQAIANAGDPVEDTTRELEKQAGALQRVTGTSDETILAINRTLIAIGQLSGEELQRATRAVLDFSALLGTEPEEAAKLFAKAAAGSAEALTRYGFILDEAIPPSERFAAVLEWAERGAAGFSEAIGSTFVGRLNYARESWGDLQEQIGSFVTRNPLVLHAIEAVGDQLQSWVEGLEENREAINEWVRSGVLLAARAAQNLVAVGIRTAQAFLGVKVAIEETLASFARWAPVIARGLELLQSDPATAGVAVARLAIAWRQEFSELRDAARESADKTAALFLRLGDVAAGSERWFDDLIARLKDVGIDVGDAGARIARMRGIVSDMGEAGAASADKFASGLRPLQAQLKEIEDTLQKVARARAAGLTFDVESETAIRALEALRDSLRSEIAGAGAFSVPVEVIPDVRFNLDAIPGGLPSTAFGPIEIPIDINFGEGLAGPALSNLKTLLGGITESIDELTLGTTHYAEAAAAIGRILDEQTESGLMLNEQLKEQIGLVLDAAARWDELEARYERNMALAQDLAGAVSGAFDQMIGDALQGSFDAGRIARDFLFGLARTVLSTLVGMAVQKQIVDRVQLASEVGRATSTEAIALGEAFAKAFAFYSVFPPTAAALAAAHVAMGTAGIATAATAGVASAAGINAGVAAAGAGPTFVEGGLVEGMAGIDTVAARLTPGEVVLPRAMVRELAELLAGASAGAAPAPAGVSAAPRSGGVIAQINLSNNWADSRERVSELADELAEVLTDRVRRRGFRLVSSDASRIY